MPCSVNLTGKRDKGGHGGATINNARIIVVTMAKTTVAALFIVSSVTSFVPF